MSALLKILIGVIRDQFSRAREILSTPGSEKYNSPYYRVYHWLASLPPRIGWGKKQLLDENEQRELAEKLASGYYIILTGSSHHLSSVMVSLLSFIKTRRWAPYSHVLINCDNITDPADRDSFKFVEATARGVHTSTFDQVFGHACDRVCLLTPKNVTNKRWTRIIDAALKSQGKPYDDLFDLSDSSHLSCVEVVWDALRADGGERDFPELSALITKTGNLVPQMYRDCQDFTVAMEK